MNAEAVQGLAKNTVRPRHESDLLCSSGASLIGLSRQLRLRHRALSQAITHDHAAGHLSKLHRMIGRRLRRGRLPHVSVPVIGGAPVMEEWWRNLRRV